MVADVLFAQKGQVDEDLSLTMTRYWVARGKAG